MLTISSLWSSKFRRKDENSCRDSSKRTHTQICCMVQWKESHTFYKAYILLTWHSSFVNPANIYMIIIVTITKCRKKSHQCTFHRLFWHRRCTQIWTHPGTEQTSFEPRRALECRQSRISISKNREKWKHNNGQCVPGQKPPVKFYRYFLQIFHAYMVYTRIMEIH